MTQNQQPESQELDAILSEYFTWKGEAIHLINQTLNYKRLKDRLIQRERAYAIERLEKLRGTLAFASPTVLGYIDAAIAREEEKDA